MAPDGRHRKDGTPIPRHRRRSPVEDVQQPEIPEDLPDISVVNAEGLPERYMLAMRLRILSGYKWKDLAKLFKVRVEAVWKWRADPRWILARDAVIAEICPTLQEEAFMAQLDLLRDENTDPYLRRQIANDILARIDGAVPGSRAKISVETEGDGGPIRLVLEQFGDDDKGGGNTKSEKTE